MVTTALGKCISGQNLAETSCGYKTIDKCKNCYMFTHFKCTYTNTSYVLCDIELSSIYACFYSPYLHNGHASRSRHKLFGYLYLDVMFCVFANRLWKSACYSTLHMVFNKARNYAAESSIAIIISVSLSSLPFWSYVWSLCHAQSSIHNLIPDDPRLHSSSSQESRSYLTNKRFAIFFTKPVHSLSYLPPLDTNLPCLHDPLWLEDNSVVDLVPS